MWNNCSAQAGATEIQPFLEEHEIDDALLLMDNLSSQHNAEFLASLKDMGVVHRHGPANQTESWQPVDQSSCSLGASSFYRQAFVSTGCLVSRTGAMYDDFDSAMKPEGINTAVEKITEDEALRGRCQRCRWRVLASQTTVVCSLITTVSLRGRWGHGRRTLND